jgi:hypothetical protein
MHSSCLIAKQATGLIFEPNKVYRWAITGDAEATQRLAKELVAQQPDLILAHNTPTTAAVANTRHADRFRYRFRPGQQPASSRALHVRHGAHAVKLGSEPRTS